MIRDEIVGMAQGILRAPPAESVADWAARNVYLDGSQSATPGYYRLDETPFNRRIMEFFQDPTADQLVIRKSSRSGATEAVLNGLRWAALHAPGHVLYAITSRDEAREIMEDRIAPSMLRVLGARADDVDEDAGGVMTLKLPNMRVRACGGGSEGPFSNKWVKYGVLDEYEDHPLNQRATGNTTAGLMRTRFATVPGWKMVILGNPSTPEGLLNKEFLAGTQEEWEVECVHCGVWQSMRWGNVDFAHCRDLTGQWDLEAVLHNTRYRCAKCGEHWAESQRAGLNQRGRWVARNQRPTPRIWSLHESDLFSPFRTWGELAVEWIKGGKNESERKMFFNKRLGLPYELGTGRRTEEDIFALRGGVVDETGERVGPEWRLGATVDGGLRRRVPVPVETLLVAIDVQRGHTKAVVGGFTKSGEILVIDYGNFGDDSGSAGGGGGSIEDWLDHGWLDCEGEVIGVDGGWRDCGDQMTEQVDWCVRNFERYGIFPSRGTRPTRGAVVWFKETPHKHTSAPWYWYQDERLKEELYLSMIPKKTEPRLWMPSDIEDHPELVYELTTERRRVRTTSAGSYYKWEGAPNDYGDCVKMLVGMRHILAARGIVDSPFGGSEEEEGGGRSM